MLTCPEPSGGERRALRVIGLGSPFGDDAVGWWVIDQLRARLPSGGGVEFLALDRPGVGLLNFLQGVEAVILIDAVCGGQPPGTLYRLTPEEAERLPAGLSSHGFGLAEALRLARALRARPARLEIHGIELGKLTGEGLSPAVEAAAKRLADRLLGQLKTAPTDRSQVPLPLQGA